jgi:cyclase
MNYRNPMFAFALFCLAGIAIAQQPQGLTVHPLKEGTVYWIEGGGGNSGVVIGQNGVIIIDAKTTADGGKQLLAEVAKLTPKPVTHVILTHSDGDHVNGLAAFPDGLTIIAHQNNKKEQETALSAAGRGAPPANRLPTQVVTKDKESMKIDGVNVTLLHWAPAHTSGDLVVYLPDQKIVFTGDIIAANRPDPLIHLEKNGSSEGWIKTTKGIVALNADSFVPGHGDLQTKAEVQKRLTDTEEKRSKIQAMVKQGKSLDDIKAAVGDTTAAPAGGKKGGGPNFPTFTEVVYQEITKKSS